MVSVAGLCSVISDESSMTMWKALCSIDLLSTAVESRTLWLMCRQSVSGGLFTEGPEEPQRPPQRRRREILGQFEVRLPPVASRRRSADDPGATRISGKRTLTSRQKSSGRCGRKDLETTRWIPRLERGEVGHGPPAGLKYTRSCMYSHD
jgi:hypothetical protein